MTPNKSLIFAKHPVNFPIPGEDLVVETSTIDLDAPPPEGGLLLKTHSLSFDPYLRGKMKPPNPGSYTPGFAIGKPISNAGVLRVLSSSSPRFKKDDLVYGQAEFSEYQIISAERASKEVIEGGFEVINNPFGLDEKIFLGALGMSGLTAYSSFYEIGNPWKGQVVFISAASGAVGQIVGQLAKRKGLTVIGSVGSEAKRKFVVDELGFHAAFNYKEEKPLAALKRLLEELGVKGLDTYYDNVGGEHLDAALAVMNVKGTISKFFLDPFLERPWGLTMGTVQCGSVSQTSSSPENIYGVKNMPLVVAKRLTIRGFLVFDPEMGPKYKEEHQEKLQKWIKDGEVTVKMSVTEGIENAAAGLVGILKGENFGKAVLKISDF